MVIREDDKVTCLLDISILGGKNIITKEAKKILIYEDPTVELQHMWNVKTKVIPVVIGGNWKNIKITQKISKQLTRIYREGRIDQAHIVNVFYLYKITFLTRKEKIDLFFHHEGSCICRNMLPINVFLEHAIKGFAKGITVRQLLALPYQFGTCDHQDTLQGAEWYQDPTLPDTLQSCCSNLDGNVSTIRRATLTRAPSDFHLFGPLKVVTGFPNVAEVREVVSQWFRSQSPDF
jgi:hypothetical protein